MLPCVNLILYLLCLKWLIFKKAEQNTFSRTLNVKKSMLCTTLTYALLATTAMKLLHRVQDLEVVLILAIFSLCICLQQLSIFSSHKAFGLILLMFSFLFCRVSFDGLFSRRSNIGPAPKTNSVTSFGSTGTDVSTVDSRNASQLEWVVTVSLL